MSSEGFRTLTDRDDPPTLPDITGTGLIGLLIHLMPGVPSERLGSLALMLYFGEMVTIFRLTRVCKGLRDYQYIWCQGCACFRRSPRREQCLMHYNNRPIPTIELASRQMNWYCWICYNYWAHHTHPMPFLLQDVLDARFEEWTQRPGAMFWTDSDMIDPRLDFVNTCLPNRLHWVTVIHIPVFAEGPRRCQHVSMRRHYFP